MISFLLLTFLLHSVYLVESGTPSEWKERTIYQLLTDRFAKDYDTTQPCANLNTYCGGTFQGVINHIDYIKDMGFDAIWISPVIENTENGYHGYWAKNIFEINPYFGMESDLLNLANVMHNNSFWLMIDVVANHMGIPGNYNLSALYPFNEWKYFHTCTECPSNCDISDWNDQNQVEICRLDGLPDLNQSNAFVYDTLISWIQNYVVSQWKADGLRIDTVCEVDMPFWKAFQQSADVYAVGEVDNGNAAYCGPYQQYLDGILSYPMFYTIRNVFGSQQSMTQIDSQIATDKQYFTDVTLLGTFVDNQDNDRFLCDYSGKIRQYENALTFVLTFVGIPIIYYGTEQEFNGCQDPNNREPLWPSNFNQNATLYMFIQTVVHARKKHQIWNEEMITVSSQSNFYAYTRGNTFLVTLTNVGDNTGTRTYTISNPNIQTNTKYCNIFWPTQDCFTYNGGSLTIYLLNGEAKIYVPSS